MQVMILSNPYSNRFDALGVPTSSQCCQPAAAATPNNSALWKHWKLGFDWSHGIWKNGVVDLKGSLGSICNISACLPVRVKRSFTGTGSSILRHNLCQDRNQVVRWFRGTERTRKHRTNGGSCGGDERSTGAALKKLNRTLVSPRTGAE